MPIPNIDYTPGNDTVGDVYDKVNSLIDDYNDFQLKWKIINIGDWNMDTTPNVTVAHGLDVTKIRSATFIIRNDAGTQFYPPASRVSSGLDSAFFAYLTTTDVELFREAASDFDSTDFDATGYNRGYITIGYIE